MPLTNTTWAWRKERRAPVHLALRGRGANAGQLATYCNRWWIADHVLPVWTAAADPPSGRRPCLLCIGWLARNGASWEVLLTWMRAQGKVIYPSTATPRHLDVA